MTIIENLIKMDEFVVRKTKIKGYRRFEYKMKFKAENTVSSKINTRHKS